MPHVGNSIRLLSANCQGLRNIEKRTDVLSYLKDKNTSIVCLQDTHLIEDDILAVKDLWNNEVYINGGKTNSRGVAILLNNNFEYEILSCNKDKNGNYLNLLITLSTITINLITLYGPNNDSPSFFEEINELVHNVSADYTILCGDFNVALDNKIDTFNYKHDNNPRARQVILDLMRQNDLSDIYRDLHPDTKRYTWRRRNPIKQARLDLFLASSNIHDITNTCEIKASYRSDHSMIELDLTISKFSQGKGLWKFNNSLLECPEYVYLINRIIEEEKLKYAIPVYELKYLKNTFTSFAMVIDQDLFLEMLLLRIRGETIKFATAQKKNFSKIENQLISDIETLEAQEPNCTANSTLLLDKKAELESIRSKKLKGHIVRSRLQWLQDGEKPSKYMSNLENKNFIEKTIKKVRLNHGEVITDQEGILSQVQQYYCNLFESKEDTLQSIKLESLGIKSNAKIPEQDIGTLLTVDEAGQVLKKMKSNKSPGIDGITVEFVKVFWRQLKHFIINAINCGFSKGCLSVSLRQCIITCLPKAKKDRSLIKNWRPISLLSVIYKLASGTIAERLKKTLNYVISDCQTGFIKGRYISESTRLIYDILHATEDKKNTRTTYVNRF